MKLLNANEESQECYMLHTLNLARKKVIPHEAKADCRAARVFQLLMDPYEIIAILMKNLKDYKAKNITQKMFNVLPLVRT